MRVLQISDLHFGEPYLPQVGAAVLRVAPDLSPDVIVVSGDLTQRAKPQEFEAAQEFLEQLPDVPQVVVPGNHDIPLYRVWERLTAPHRNYKQYISPQLNSTLLFPEAAFVALDSTAPHRSIVNGRLHRGQLDFCRQGFSQVGPDAARIIVAHHHFAPAPDYHRDQVLPKAKRAINLFVDLDVDIIMGGHLHRAYIGNTLDVYAGRHKERGIIIIQCGTTTSRRGKGREREKNSFNVIDLDEHTVLITHYMYFDEEDEFLPVGRHWLPRPGRTFVDSPRWGAEFAPPSDDETTVDIEPSEAEPASSEDDW